MAAAARAGPVLLRAMASGASHQTRGARYGTAGATWRRAGDAGRLRSRVAAAAPRPATRWASPPRRDPAAFRLFAGAADGPGEASDDEKSSARDYLAELDWLPPLDPTKETEEIDPEAEPTTMVLPVFPLGSTAYMPHSDHILNIFEPRYRQMYSDILFNGSRRFAVPVSHPETGRLAAVAPVFYLEDLKEVS